MFDNDPNHYYSKEVYVHTYSVPHPRRNHKGVLPPPTGASRDMDEEKICRNPKHRDWPELAHPWVEKGPNGRCCLNQECTGNHNRPSPGTLPLCPETHELHKARDRARHYARYHNDPVLREHKKARAKAQAKVKNSQPGPCSRRGCTQPRNRYRNSYSSYCFGHVKVHSARQYAREMDKRDATKIARLEEALNGRGQS